MKSSDSWISRLGLTHYNVSMAKSVLRVGAGLALCFGSFVMSGILIVLAEVLGIVEEMV